MGSTAKPSEALSIGTRDKHFNNNKKRNVRRTPVRTSYYNLSLCSCSLYTNTANIQT
jgi:hypothetical protein